MLMTSKQLKQTEVCVDTETTGVNPHRATMLGFSLATAADSKWILNPSKVETAKLNEYLKGKSILTQNGKYDAIVLSKHGIFFEIDYDTMIAEYILHIDKPRNLEDMFERRFGTPKKCLIDLFNEANADKKPRVNLPDGWYAVKYGKPTKKEPQGKLLHYGVSMEALGHYAKEDVEAVRLIKEDQMKEFSERPELYKWFKEVEIPVQNILIKAELKGVKLDLNEVAVLRAEVEKKCKAVEAKLKFIAGGDINFRSTKQLQEVMYEKLGLPKLLKTKTGWATGKKVLKKMENRAFPKLLMEYSQYNKLLTGFLEPLPTLVDENNRLHTTFNQALTDTRRFSSEDPNLQNIPARTDLGKWIRRCFVPERGYKFLVADYSQIEPRLLAHFSSDPFLIEAFNTDKDLYDFVSNLMTKRLGRDFPRDMSKILVLSLIYGKTAYGLAQDWKCSEQEAQGIIDLFFGLFTKVEQWMKDTISTSRMRKSWGKSIAGLPLHIVAKDKKGDILGDLNDTRQWVREAAERCAVNYPIQSSSQDVIKKAMVDVYKSTGLVPVLFVHDEMVFELDLDNHILCGEHKTIVQKMESAWKLAVPLKVSAKITDYWEK